MLETLTEEQMENVVYDARYGDLDTLRAIFEQEVDPKVVPEVRDPSSGATMVHMAAANGHLEVVEFLGTLIKNEDALKAYLNATNTNGNTALHWAAFNGHLEVVKYLCEHGADPFLRNEYGHDVFYEAGNNEKEKVEDYLLERYGEELDAQMERDFEEGETATEATGAEPTVEFKKGSEIAQVGDEDAVAMEKLRKEAEKLQVDN